LDAVDTGDTEASSARQAAAEQAAEAGRRLARTAGAADVVAVLEEQGFEPHVEDGMVRLGNCPFHHLAQRHTDLVCGINLHLVGGLLEGLPGSGYTARLRPSPDHCCVVLDTE
ncbi:MAG: transcriptional regulator, partial [Marmoricola sp.]|nr:transcriptional regulator [Marmoricola sp.]